MRNRGISSIPQPQIEKVLLCIENTGSTASNAVENLYEKKSTRFKQKRTFMKSTFPRKPYNFKLEMAANNQGVSSFGGLPLIRKALAEIGLFEKIRDIFYLKRFLKHGGYEDAQILEAVILLIASGGTCFSDWELLIADPGFKKMFGHCMSVDVLERYLKRLVVTVLDTKTEKGQSGYSTLLEMIHREMLLLAYQLAGSPESLTLDIDTSIYRSKKSDATFCYEMVKAYQPMMAYCPELSMVVAHEFRDGNIAPQVGYDRLVKRSRDILSGVKHWTVRSDSAGYQVEMLDQWASEGIVFYVTADQFSGMQEILKTETKWQKYISNGVTTDQEVTEISYVPNFSNQQELKFRRNVFRFIAVRKLKSGQLELGVDKYIYQVIVTNTQESDLNKILKTHWQRCGSIEHVHEELKNGCGLKRFPSKHFRVNAAWCSLGVLTHNVLRMIQKHVLPEKFKDIEIRTLNHRFIRSAIWIREKAKQIIVRCCKDHPLYGWYKEAQEKLEQMSYRLMQFQ